MYTQQQYLRSRYPRYANTQNDMHVEDTQLSVLVLGLIYAIHTPQRRFNVGLKLINLNDWNGTITFVGIMRPT